MSEHSWIREEDDDDEPFGPHVSWRCSTCGVGGGPADLPGRSEPREPFILGPGPRVSRDCEEAQKQIRSYAEEMIARLRAKWKSDKGEHRHYASLFHDALIWNPQIKNIGVVLDLIRAVEHPGVFHNYKRPSIIDCRRELTTFDFKVVP
jgi:hypothetical protein